ncbi:FkbM family methyltransferase [Paraburkholderia humisilvae]|uniref:Methyltransferase FkbM domain-containing protein n=1 Tax=Paraburkholderia humisilvae TaxID=627669 RepID=A0A6J5F5A5_9BURK|nr:FkbM family methyltransferase [Paraburkholderia humisilvae]CAB3773998.1 hypothetical protein LMG29542_07552 [Paraburkholderia humisilvae]
MDVDSLAIGVADPYDLVSTRYGLMLANRNDVYIGRALIVYGEYCECETQFLKRWIDRPGTIVEVGANIGSQTVALAMFAKAVGADVMAFEPQPFVFQNLCANLALNAVENVTTWPFACTSHAGSVGFERPDYRRPGNFGGISLKVEPETLDTKVPSVRLDDIVGRRDVTLMKVDVEGFELNVLQGAVNTISRCRPVVYVENDRVGQSAALITYLWGLGYRLWWHISPLFNPQNYRGNAENLYPMLGAFNMVGLPRESNIVLQDAEITDATFHPLAVLRD